ncbi:flagellar protein FliT [Brevibacillus formosus]|uniref:flagellar protein FliT n=1 Tax=Brevibacillus formosus TaxID=54913 RepID=UPI001CA4982E|nr:flagellar protein FliT [Brevibacillus formosus]MBW5468692.1 flagellar protein FliT [Brevibacillus formosus]
MEKTVDTLLESLLGVTLCLEQTVLRKDSDPEEWITLLDEREKLVEKLNEAGLTEAILTDKQRRQIVDMNEVNLRLIPIIADRKQAVQKQLNNVQKSKLAMNSYQDEGISGYGAFFDRKK